MGEEKIRQGNRGNGEAQKSFRNVWLKREMEKKNILIGKGGVNQSDKKNRE